MGRIRRTNRVDRGDVALNAYALHQHQGPEDSDAEETVIDCVTDILHAAKYAGLNPKSILRMVSSHVEAEIK